MVKQAILDAEVYVYDGNRHQPQLTNIFITDGIIEKISSEEPDDSYQKKSFPNCRIVPAVYDTHCHGGGPLCQPNEGIYDFKKSEFIYNDDTVKQAFDIMFHAHAACGTGYINASFPATDTMRLENGLTLLSEKMNTHKGSAVCKGFDFESIYFCDNDNGGYTGGQNSDCYIKPDVSYFKHLQAIALNNIRRVGIGFEWDQLFPDEKPGLKLAEYLRDEDIVIGIGHSGAKEQNLKEAFFQGGKFVYIHFGNGLNVINLRQNQARPFESASDMVYCAEKHGVDLYSELILDGVHLDKRFVLWANYMFGKEKIIGVTDAGLTGTLPVNRYNYGKHQLVIPEDNPNAIWIDGYVGERLCGSKATAEILLRNYLHVMMDPGNDGEGITPYFLREKHPPKPLPEAMDWAIHALATNPATLYGETMVGAIQAGKDASFIVLNVAENPFKLDVIETWVQGNKINTEL